MECASGSLASISVSDQLGRDVAVMETKEFSADQFFFKIKAELPAEHKFQVRIYYNRGHIDYAYQLSADEPLLRSDKQRGVSPSGNLCAVLTKA